MLEVMFTKCLMEALFKWAKRQCHTDKLAMDLEVLAVIAQEKIIKKLLLKLSRLILYKLWGIRWSIITGTILSYTLSILFWDKYDKPFWSSILREISLVSSLLQ